MFVHKKDDEKYNSHGINWGISYNLHSVYMVSAIETMCTEVVQDIPTCGKYKKPDISL